MWERCANVARGSAFRTAVVVPHAWLERGSGGKKTACPNELLHPCSPARLPASFLQAQVEPKLFASRHFIPHFLIFFFFLGGPGGLELKILMFSFLLIRERFPDRASQGQVGDLGKERGKISFWRRGKTLGFPWSPCSVSFLPISAWHKQVCPPPTFVYMFWKDCFKFTRRTLTKTGQVTFRAVPSAHLKSSFIDLVTTEWEGKAVCNKGEMSTEY